MQISNSNIVGLSISSLMRESSYSNNKSSKRNNKHWSLKLERRKRRKERKMKRRRKRKNNWLPITARGTSSSSNNSNSSNRSNLSNLELPSWCNSSNSKIVKVRLNFLFKLILGTVAPTQTKINMRPTGITGGMIHGLNLNKS